MDEKLSERISLLRFPLIIGVVLIHSYGSGNTITGVEFSGDNLHASTFVRDYFSQVLARVSVPLFYFISGILLLGRYSWSPADIKTVYQKRFKSLVIPYLFWNVLYFIIYFVVASIPSTATMIGGGNSGIVNYGSYQIIDSILGLEKCPIAYQFWFIQDLITIVLVYPVLSFVLKKGSWLFIIALGVMWIFEYRLVNFPGLTSVGLLFFCLGGQVGMKRLNLIRLDAFGKLIVLIYGIISVIDVSTKHLEYNEIIHKIGIFVGVFAVFPGIEIVGRVVPRSIKIIQRCSEATFWVFAVHAILILGSIKIAYKIFNPESDIFVLLLYFLCPSIVVGICLVSYKVLNRLLPRFTSVITGRG
ncbi:MAG: acyltransferase [Fibrobacterales bacterium]